MFRNADNRRRIKTLIEESTVSPPINGEVRLIVQYKAIGGEIHSERYEDVAKKMILVLV